MCKSETTMSNVISLEQQDKISHILTPFSRDEAIWAVKYLIKKIYAAPSSTADDKAAAPRRAAVKSRERDLPDDKLAKVLAEFHDIDDIPDVNISAFLRGNSGKSLKSFEKWL